MKRAKQLIALSHDHHHALVLVRRAERVVSTAIDSFNEQPSPAHTQVDAHMVGADMGDGLHIEQNSQIKHARNSHEKLVDHEVWCDIAAFLLQQRNQHFAVEERFLIRPLLSMTQDLKVCTNEGFFGTLTKFDVIMMATRVMAEHKQLCVLLASDGSIAPSKRTRANLSSFASLLRTHVKFEERSLFPLIQQVFTRQQLDAIAQAMQPSSV